MSFPSPRRLARTFLLALVACGVAAPAAQAEVATVDWWATQSQGGSWVNSNYSQGQTFTPTYSGSLTRAEVMIDRDVCTDPSTLEVGIYEMNADGTMGALVAATVIDYTQVPADDPTAGTDVVFPQPVQLEAGRDYLMTASSNVVADGFICRGQYTWWASQVVASGESGWERTAYNGDEWTEDCAGCLERGMRLFVDLPDLDRDGVPDGSDADDDGDGVADAEDDFPRDAAEQKDTDSDGVGDTSDAFDNDPTETRDTDADGRGDNSDNCVADANADQADLDRDGKGDACDADVDGDGTPNGSDAFPRDPAESSDRDGDTIGDNADRFPDDPKESADADADGIGDGADNCKTNANADQADLDSDGKGDACDADDDGDGVNDDTDNAPRTPNADQQDLDDDGVGDVIDRKVLPLNADMCKREGFKRFYDGTAGFKNQGDCVSFVATGGRNLLAG